MAGEFVRPCRPLPLRPLFEEEKRWNESYDRRRGMWYSIRYSIQ